MDNLRSVLSIVLSKIPSKEILENKILYNDITRDVFVKLSGYYVKNYSNDELDNLFSYAQNEYVKQADYVSGYGYHSGESEKRFNIFDAILIFAFRILEEMDGEPACKYEHLLRWRMTSHELDEDVFTTAFLAFKDNRNVNEQRDFSWRPVIRHNNMYLNRLLSQGMADNHFHLKGSAPQFPISWISMMNNVVSTRFRKLLEDYSNQRLSTSYYTGTDEEHLYISYLKAALIRCYLFSKLTDQIFFIEMDEEKETEKDEKRKDLCREQIESRTNQLVIHLLKHRDDILFYRNEIQSNISYYKSHSLTPKYIYSSDKKSVVLDYALNGEYNHRKSRNDVNYILSGERWFMYTMFQKIYGKDLKFKKYFNLFYAYLVIKETIRAELVQTNTNIGFDNFEKFQNRKEDFIEGTPFEEKYIDLAIRGTLYNQNIISLEARISPKNSDEENRNYIRKLDRWIELKDKSLLQRYFYVFHFIKGKDSDNTLSSDVVCRHAKKRDEIKEKAWAIARFRENYPKEAKRVRGIDACAKEIGCRPEVFAQTYRFLKHHIVYHSGRMEENVLNDRHPVKMQQLSLTYHIGEDYLDLIDGLRAIDEAVRFLKLDCGSRMGHALALGVDVEEYYRIKNYKILITQQDYLDNIVWLYNRIKKFGLTGYEDLLLQIEQEYNKYFRIIYGNYICDSFFHNVVKEAREYFKKKDHSMGAGYCNSHFNFRISEYYSAWQLRGDNPECYFHGYFKELSDSSMWNRYAVNIEHTDDYKMRLNPECAYLYFLYHYSSQAKEEGAKRIEIKISHKMVQCVKEVQSKMQRWIGKLGIGIETNPSSNYFIGTFKRYDKHPIFDFYNLGLTVSKDDIDNCPQLPVCLNTDDQGIFSTYLENEYALLALALEKIKDENGDIKYNRTMIYQWIDHVRKMGLNLSFANVENYSGDSRTRFSEGADEDLCYSNGTIKFLTC